MSYSLRLSWGFFPGSKWHFTAFVIGHVIKFWISTRHFFFSINGERKRYHRPEEKNGRA